MNRAECQRSDSSTATKTGGILTSITSRKVDSMLMKKMSMSASESTVDTAWRITRKAKTKAAIFAPTAEASAIALAVLAMTPSSGSSLCTSFLGEILTSFSRKASSRSITHSQIPRLPSDVKTTISTQDATSQPPIGPTKRCSTSAINCKIWDWSATWSRGGRRTSRNCTTAWGKPSWRRSSWSILTSEWRRPRVWVSQSRLSGREKKRSLRCRSERRWTGRVLFQTSSYPWSVSSDGCSG